MADGTVYAGISPKTHRPMYTTLEDAPGIAPSRRTNSWGFELPLGFTFGQAAKYAKKLDAHDHDDWRVPTKGELNVLFNNRAAIGGFDVSGTCEADEIGPGWYWSSSSFSFPLGGWCQRFSDGNQWGRIRFEDFASSLRCVRG